MDFWETSLSYSLFNDVSWTVFLFQLNQTGSNRLPGTRNREEYFTWQHSSLWTIVSGFCQNIWWWHKNAGRSEFMLFQHQQQLKELTPSVDLMSAQSPFSQAVGQWDVNLSAEGNNTCLHLSHLLRFTQIERRNKKLGLVENNYKSIYLWKHIFTANPSPSSWQTLTYLLVIDLSEKDSDSVKWKGQAICEWGIKRKIFLFIGGNVWNTNHNRIIGSKEKQKVGRKWDLLSQIHCYLLRIFEHVMRIINCK